MRQLYDIPYSREAGADGVRVMDIFLPDEQANGACLFFVHGGGWSAGSKESWHPVMAHYCARGYACTSLRYHLAPAWRFPAQIDDVRLAISFLRLHAAEYGFDPQRIAAWGSSAGGHLAALLATIQPGDDLGFTPEMALRDIVPNAVICYCSVFTLRRQWLQERLAAAIETLLGMTEDEDPARYRQASPLDRITGNEPPFLMIVGDADDLTPVMLHETMRDALGAKGVRADCHVLPSVEHGFGYGTDTAAQQQSIALVDDFLCDVLLNQVKRIER